MFRVVQGFFCFGLFPLCVSFMDYRLCFDFAVNAMQENTMVCTAVRGAKVSSREPSEKT